MKKVIGMLVAVEIDAVLKKYGTPAEEYHHGRLLVRKYEAENYDLYVMQSGAGEIGAAAGTQLLISCYHAELILNFGVVGGLTPDMALAKSCIVERVVHYDIDTSAIDNIEPARYFELPDVYIPVDQTLVDKAVSIHPELKRVTCASADKFVALPERKAELHTLYGADICEMEAGAIALTCYRNEVPCLMIKTVSDSITGGADEFAKEILRSSDIAISIADEIIRSL